MSQELEIAIAAWREADSQARQAEQLLAEAMARDLTGGPDINQLIQSVAGARGKANDKLTIAIAAMKAANSANRS